MEKTLALMITLISFSFLHAQHSIQSSILNKKDNEPLDQAIVKLIRVKDSTFIQGARSDEKGFFILKKIPDGNYLLTISYMGFENYNEPVTLAGKNIILKNIHLSETSQALNTVEVRGTAAQMTVKGDTLEYNAGAFKTVQNSVVEDLLKRLPGVEVSTDGKITVNGEEVKRVRVNGKKFFNDDMQMATKNIPAELIDKVQVVDQKSEMAQLTGFEDNETERIINLTFKPNRRRGLFGNFTGAGGMDLNENFRYDSNIFLNLMDGDAQTSITGGANNTNTSRSGRNRGWSGGSNSGISTTQNLGINNNTQVNDELKFGGDGTVNHTNNDNRSESNRTSYIKGKTYTDKSRSTSFYDSYSANMRLETEWKIDSTKTFIIQPNIGYARSFNDSKRDFSYLTENDSTSWGSSSNWGNSYNLNAGLNLIYNYKSKVKRGRTTTTSFRTGFTQTQSSSYNVSNKFTDTSLTHLNQHTDNDALNFNNNVRFSYVEPLWNLKNFLETSVSLSSSTRSSQKDQYFRDIAGNDSAYNTEYSNKYNNRFFSETLEMNYKYATKDLDMTFGFKGEPSQTYSYTTYGDGQIRDVSNKVINFSPNARVKYNLEKKKYVRIDYRGQTTQPEIDQMQPVKNNSNLMIETVGNPSLNPSFSHRLFLIYNSFNDSTFASFNASLRGSITKDALVSNSIYDATGKQYNQTVNAKSMPFNMDGSVMFNIPLVKKLFHFNTRTSAGFDQRFGYSSILTESSQAITDTTSLILGNLSSTKTYNAGEQLALTFTHEKIEMGVKGQVNYSNTLNNLNTNSTEVINWLISGNVIARLPYSINVTSDINFNKRIGYGGFDQNELLWNASIDKSVLNNKGVVALKLFDILHQQLNIRQTVGDNYIQFNRYNTLGSYFLLSFTYKMNKFGGVENKNEDLPNFDKFGPGMRPGRGEGGRGGMSGERPDRF